MSLDVLRDQVAGEVALPGDVDYGRRRSVFNARIDRHPAAIVACSTPPDVQATLALAREHGLPVVVRAGGMSDDCVVDGGVVIDVSPMDEVVVDPATRRAHVGAGVTWAQLDAATQEHGLAVTGGRVSFLSVAGVTLTGGSGWLERTLGRTFRSLSGAELVLADGTIVTTSEGERPDLVRALRERGPGDGVVTRLELDLHPVGPLLVSGFLTYPRERAAAVLARYRDVLGEAPPELIGGLSLFAGRGGACTLAFGYVGSEDAGHQAVRPLRELRPALDAVMVNEYRAMQAMTDLQNPYGMRVHRRRGLLGDLTADAIQALVQAADRPAAALSRVLVRPLGGALAHDAPSALWAYDCMGLWPPLPELDAGNIAWVEHLHEALAPFVVSESG